MSGSNSAPFDMRAMLEALAAIDDDGVATGGGDEDTEIQESRSECEVEKKDEKEKEGEEEKEKEVEEKKEDAEKIDVAPSRFRTWRGLQNVPTGPANPSPAPTQPRSSYQPGPPRQFGPSYPPYNPYGPDAPYQPRPTPLTPGHAGSLPPSPFQASPAAPPAVPAPSGLSANPASGPSQPQQPQDNGPPKTASVSAPGRSKVQKSGKAQKKKKKRDEEKKIREAESEERERKREEKERKEEEEKKKQKEEEKERERKMEERERERERREEERRKEDREREEERRREEREREERRHREFLEMMAAQEAARRDETARQEAARAVQAERDRTLASFNTLAAGAEQRFASQRSNYLEARGRETDPYLWGQFNTAVTYCDRVLSQIYNWRSSVVVELGSTPESALSFRLSAIENEAAITLRDAPRITAPAPAPAPAPALPAPSAPPALSAPPARPQLEAASSWGHPPVTFNVITNAPADPAASFVGQPYQVGPQQHFVAANAQHQVIARSPAIQRYLGEVEVEMTDAGDEDQLD